MRTKCAALLVLLLIGTDVAWPVSQHETSPAAEPGASTVVYVVRHAEKAVDVADPRDPGLSALGLARREALGRVLVDVPLRAVYATEYRRSRETVEPLAGERGLAVTVAPARDTAGLAKAILESHRGEAVLVAGHSNTVPAILRALGAAEAPDLAESDYDDLFILTIPAEGSAVLTRLHYGPPDDAGAATDLAASAGAMLDDFHDAAAKADEDRYFGHFHPRGLFLGTDAGERWMLDEFKAFAMPYFERETAWTYQPRGRQIDVSEDGQWAWFDEALVNVKYGRCRGTGTLRRVGGRWTIVQYHLTMPIPNDLALETANRIAEHEKREP